MRIWIHTHHHKPQHPLGSVMAGGQPALCELKGLHKALGPSLYGDKTTRHLLLFRTQLQCYSCTYVEQSNLIGQLANHLITCNYTS